MAWLNSVRRSSLLLHFFSVLLGPRKLLFVTFKSHTFHSCCTKTVSCFITRWESLYFRLNAHCYYNCFYRNSYFRSLPIVACSVINLISHSCKFSLKIIDTVVNFLFIAYVLLEAMWEYIFKSYTCSNINIISSIKDNSLFCLNCAFLISYH